MTNQTLQTMIIHNVIPLQTNKNKMNYEYHNSFSNNERNNVEKREKVHEKKSFERHREEQKFIFFFHLFPKELAKKKNFTLARQNFIGPI